MGGGGGVLFIQNRSLRAQHHILMDPDYSKCSSADPQLVIIIIPDRNIYIWAQPHSLQIYPYTLKYTLTLYTLTLYTLTLYTLILYKNCRVHEEIVCTKQAFTLFFKWNIALYFIWIIYEKTYCRVVVLFNF